MITTKTNQSTECTDGDKECKRGDFQKHTIIFQYVGSNLGTFC